MNAPREERSAWTARKCGYRYVIAGKYICVYRLVAGTVYVYHMAHGASNYPTLFRRLMKEENP